MSNEKLGAEQGRGFDFEAIGDAIDRVLAGQRELTPAEQKNLRGIYSKLFTKLKPEQAYHARGAGRNAAKCVNCGHDYLDHYSEDEHSSHCLQRDPHSASFVPQACPCPGFVRGPGADTGTTPPPDVWTCEACGYKSDDIGEYREVCGKCFSAAAERGKTPPEGLREALAEEFHNAGHCGYDHGTWAQIKTHGIECQCFEAADIALRALAATQRAPVENRKVKSE